MRKLEEYIENSIYETEKFCKETINHINKARSKEQSTKLKKISEEILKKMDKINHSKMIKKENESNILKESFNIRRRS